MVQINRQALCYFIWVLIAVKTLKADQSKAVGGRLAKPGEFPCQLCMFGEYRCGGALVTMKRFITAGHCFVYRGTAMEFSKQFIAAGVVDCTKINDPYYQQRRIIDYVIHPDFRNKKDKTSYYDLAVGVLDQPFIETHRVKAGVVPTFDPDVFRRLWKDRVENRKTCTAMGFGAQQGPHGFYSLQWGNELRVVEVMPKSDRYCKSTLIYEEDKMLDGEVCAKAVNPETESLAPGDSGTGLICDGYLYGVITGGVHVEGGINNQLFTLVYPYFSFYSALAASDKVVMALVIFGVLTAASVNVSLL